jgi:hypothetical protein
MALASSSLSKLGTNPLCIWTSATDFEIIFGASATILPDDLLTFNIGFAENTFIPVNARVTSAVPIKPTAVLLAPSQVGPCDGITLDGSLSSSLDRRSLSYQWSIIDGYKLNAINAYLSNQTNPVVYLDSSLLSPGFTYKFALVVQSAFGLNSVESLVQVTKSNAPSPIVQIRGPSVQTAFISGFMKLEAIVSIAPAECFYSDRTLLFSWRQLSGPLVSPQGMNQRVLSFLPFAFVRFSQVQYYTFEVTVRPAANVNIFTTATVTIQALPRPLVAQIADGSRTISRDYNITLNASSSYDPDRTVGDIETFVWTCYDAAGSYCKFANGFTLPNSSIAIIPPYTLAEGVFSFSLNYIKGGRLATARTSITVAPGLPPIINIKTFLPSKINRNEKVSVLTQVTLISGDPLAKLRYQWRITNSNGNDISKMLRNMGTDLNQQNLIIQPNLLEIGEEYVFTLIASVLVGKRSGSDVSGSASTGLTVVNEPPRPGSCAVSPSSGIAAETKFESVCVQWTDEDLPLTYTFGYLDAQNRFVALARSSFSNRASFALPSGNPSTNHSLTIVSRVVDKLGAVSEVRQVITVKPPTAQNATEMATIAAQKADAQLNQMLASKDAESVVQVVSALTQLVNTPSPQILSNSSCPNKCSLHGSCIKGGCICDQGWTTKDCSVQTEELKVRQNLRQKLLTSLVQAANVTSAQEPLSLEFVLQQATVASQIVNKPEELNLATKNLAIQYATSLVQITLAPASEEKGQNAIPMNDEVATAIVSTLNGVTATVKPSSNAVDPVQDRKDVKQLSGSIIDTVRQLQSAISASQIPGEQPIAISQPEISLSVQKVIPFVLNDLFVNMQSFDTARSSAKVNLPENLVPQLSNSLLNADSVSIQAVNYGTNMYAWSDSSQNISSSIVSFSLKTGDNQEIPVYNLSKAINITVPGSFNASALNLGCVNSASYVPSCRYWDVVSESWKGDGCVVATVTNDYIICSCNHLTSFAGFVEYITPDMNILTPEDLLNTVMLNTDNYTTLIVCMCMLGIYWILMLVTFLMDRVTRRTKYNEREKLQKMGKCRKFIEYIKRTHLWLSILFRPVSRRSYTRPQRITVIFIAILVHLMVNALFYQKEQANIARTIIASLVSFLITWPLPYLLGWLFKWTSPDRPVKSITEDKVLAQVLETPIELQVTNISETNPEVPPAPVPDEKQPSKNKLVQALDLADNTLDKIEQRVRMQAKDNRTRTYLFGLAIILLFLLFIAGVVAGVCALMETFFTSFWGRKSTISFICAVIVILTVLFEVMYFTEKKRYYAKKQIWPIPKVQLILAAVVAAILVLGILGAIGSAIGLQFWLPENTDIATYHFVVVGHAVILIICCIMFIVLNLRKPRIRFDDGTIRPRTYPLPWWCLFILYPFCWALIGVFTFIIIAYGIKFKQTKANHWLLSSFLGISFDVFLVKPVNVLFRAFLFSIVMDTIHAIAFNWEVTVKTERYKTEMI